jgi:hypothetical protein
VAASPPKLLAPRVRHAHTALGHSRLPWTVASNSSDVAHIVVVVIARVKHDQELEPYLSTVVCVRQACHTSHCCAAVTI